VKIKNMLRTLFGIRRTRQRLPPGKQPMVGSNIVREQLRIHLKYPVTNEQWMWLTEIGWRTIDMRITRREYSKVDDRALRALIRAPSVVERERVHQAILDEAEKSAARKEARRNRRKRPQH
jgi:hypothetical protein